MDKLKYLKHTQNILDFARLNAEMTLYLYNPRNEEIFHFINTTLFLNNIRTACQRITIVETFKLISSSKNDIHSLFNLYIKIGQNHKQEKLNKELEKYVSIIENIRLLRNKVYGHKDTSYEFEIDYDFLVVRNFIIELQNLFSEIVKSVGHSLDSKLNEENIDFLNGKIFFENIFKQNSSINYP